MEQLCRAVVYNSCVGHMQSCYEELFRGACVELFYIVLV